MKRLTIRCIVTIVAILATGCATVEDVRTASDLIRTDNELARILQEAETGSGISRPADLASVASHATGEAEGLKHKPGKIPEAIAYYRIAATAYWQMDEAREVDAFFKVVSAGSQLCVDLGEKAPDRDCLFMGFVIPFAGLETKMDEEPDPAQMLSTVNFIDGTRTEEEINTMKEVYAKLIETKPLVQSIFARGNDDRLYTHPSMRQYYCTNAEKALAYYSPRAIAFETRVIDYHDNFKDGRLEIDLDAARDIRKLNPGIPKFCQ